MIRVESVWPTVQSLHLIGRVVHSCSSCRRKLTVSDAERTSARLHEIRKRWQPVEALIQPESHLVIRSTIN
jgi:glyoxylate utilization-related uncharacterized protein